MGSNVVDVFVKTDAEESDLIKIQHGLKGETEELVAYPLGTKILIKHIDFQIGGGGTNTAVAFARLGLNTAYLGKIGKDENGLKVFNLLKTEGVEFIGTLGEMNGYSVILDSVGDDRTILTYKGCNNELSFKEIKKSKLKARAYYLCSMMGTSLTTLASIAKHARKEKALVVFNPSSYLVKEGVNPIKTILDNTDVLILNNEEAQELGGFGTVPELAERLEKLGPKTIVITMGAQGVLAYYKKTHYLAKPKQNIIIHETTGAGDSFGSTFIAGLLQERPIEECIKMAMINSESVIANYGAKNILLSKELMEKKLSADKRTITKTSVGTKKQSSTIRKASAKSSTKILVETKKEIK